jgi:precorrin-6B methylase 2
MPEPLQMVQLLAGFQVSQALYAVAKLGVATALLGGPQTVQQLAAATSSDADALGRVVRFLATLGLFRISGTTVEITDLGATLAEGSPGSIRDVALYWMETHYAPFGQLLHTVRTGETAATRHYGKPFFEWLSADPGMVELQNNAMAVVTNGLRAGMFDDYRLPEGNLVADIGGADGSMICQLLAREPSRRAIVFDRPEVVPSARKVLDDHGLSGRTEIMAGDFFESVPAADVYLLSFIMHDWDDGSCTRILRNIAVAAATGARAVLVEAVIPAGDAPHPAKVIDLTMLVMVTGRERTAEEYETLLASAGFRLDRIVPTPTPFSFIEATVR